MLDTGQLFELSEGWRVPPGAALVSVSADHGLWERHVPGGTGKLLRMLRGLKELYEAEGRKVPPNEYDEFRGAISQALDSRRIYWLGQFRARGLTGLIMKGREAAPDRSTATLNVESCPVPALLPTEFPIESRPARVRDFLDKRPGKYKVDIYLSAKVDKKNFRQWERGEMSNSSAMADRIEEVLRGEKALVERPKRP